MASDVTQNEKLNPDVASTEVIRGYFPALEREHAGRPVAYFDGPGGTQVPRQVVDSMSDYLLNHNANTHWNYPTSAETDAALAHARQVFADFFNASAQEVSFGNNMTTITFHVSRALGRTWGHGDEIVVTELDHHANVAPWRALTRERGITIRAVPFNIETGELVWEELESAITPRTRLVAIGAASNALGTINPIKRVSDLAHSQGALCFVDAVHFAAHELIDVKAMDCDFLVCSPYKFYGPHAGVMYTRGDVLAALDVPKLDPAPNEIPDRIETGTQNHEGIVGSAAGVEFLASLASGETRRERVVAVMRELHRRGQELVSRLWAGLEGIKSVTCYGPLPGQPRTPTISFSVSGKKSAQVAKGLASEAIFASNGNFYAATVIERLGFAGVGLIRAGCACYTTEEEVDRLIQAVGKAAG
jgi:cysteine desulfurase family protein (TIGR01976 family)